MMKLIVLLKACLMRLFTMTASIVLLK